MMLRFAEQNNIMKLLLDIGNTNSSLALCEGKRIKKRYFIYTLKEEICAEPLKRLLGKDLKHIDTAVIVSVAPKFLKIFKKTLKDIAPWICIKVIGKDLTVPIKNNYKEPLQVGQDRLVASFAAKKMYRTPLLVIDFGTAVTFDYVNEKGEYEGGLIFPGVRLALESLSSGAALLPEINLKDVRGFLGKSTSASMNKGMVFGYASMCEGMILRFKKKYGKELQVVATGGDAKLIAKHTKHIETISPDLIFKGLNFLGEFV